MGYPYPNFCFCAFLGPYHRIVKGSVEARKERRGVKQGHSSQPVLKSA